jgi:hypothetical protein
MTSTAKTWVQMAFVGLAALIPGLTVGWPLSVTGWINIVVLFAGAIMIYNAANLPGYNVAKTIASAVVAVGVGVISALTDGAFMPEEIIQIILAFGAAVGVYLVPNGATVGRHAVA